MKKLFAISLLVVLTVWGASAQKKNSVTELSEVVNSLSGHVDTVALQLGDLSAQVSSLTEQVTVLTNHISTLAASQAAVQQQLCQMVEANKALTAKLDELSSASASEDATAAPTYTVVGNMSSGLVVVRENVLYGYVDAEGKYVIPAQFEAASSFHGNYAVVKMNDRWGLIDKTGKVTIDCKYLNIEIYNGDVYKVFDGTKYGLIAANGTMVQDLKFSEIGAVSARWKRSRVCIDGKYGVLDGAGKLLVAVKYDAMGYWDDDDYVSAAIGTDYSTRTEYIIKVDGTVIRD